VASFGHIAGSLYQNEKEFGHYISTVEAGMLPVHRSYELTHDEAMVRELILQLKLGRVSFDYFKAKFAVDVNALFKVQLEALEQQKFIRIENQGIIVESIGLLKVDEWLKRFYLPQHQPRQTEKNAIKIS
jgi:oxygen-independent coproporphyrinogen-3 oxidase